MLEIILLEQFPTIENRRKQNEQRLVKASLRIRDRLIARK